MSGSRVSLLFLLAPVGCFVGVEPLAGTCPRVELGAFRSVDPTALPIDAAPSSADVIFADGSGFGVLDPDERTIRRFDRDGHSTVTVPIPSPGGTFAVALRDHSGFAILRRLPDAGTGFELQIASVDGALRTTVPLTPNFSAPSGIFEDSARNDSLGSTSSTTEEARILVEQAHGQICLPDGNGCKPGLPDGTGVYVQAEKLDQSTLRLSFFGIEPLAGPDIPAWAIPEKELPTSDERQVTLHTDRMLSNVVALAPVAFPEEGQTIHAVLAVLLLYGAPSSGTRARLEPELRAVLMDSSGRKRDELRLEAGPQNDEGPSVALADGGALFQLRIEGDDVTVLRTDLVLARGSTP
jgi:hypothetical protein